MEIHQQPVSGCHLMVALSCEATPLIRHFKLQRVTSEAAFAIYQNEGLTLTVSGPGKVAMAIATAYTQARYHVSSDTSVWSWLNIGVAGCATQNIGRVFIASRVEELSSERNWYPIWTARQIPASISICTVDTPEVTYTNKEVAYEMEAAAFFDAACRFSSLELVHAMKVISDNNESGVEQITSDSVSLLVENALLEIDATVTQLKVLSQAVTMANHWPELDLPLEQCCEHWHLTHQQQKQLTDLLSQWQIRSTTPLPPLNEWPYQGKTRQMLNWLTGQIDALPFEL